MIHLETQYTVDKEKKRILIQRTFNAPIGVVWSAWTDHKILDKWWAPKPWKAETKTMDFKVGGRWLYCMVGPEGERHWSGADYTKIEEQKCFHGTDFFCDESGNLLAGFPVMKWEVKFESQGKYTHVEVINSFEKLEDLEKIIEMGFKEGFAAAHTNLDELLRTI